MEQGDPIPCHLPQKHVFRQAKHEQKLKLLPHKDVITSICQLKEGELRNALYDIGMNPFYVFYTMPLQTIWYNKQAKRENMVISIDTTGSLIKLMDHTVISTQTDKLKHKYESIRHHGKNSEESVLIGQMISQNQTSASVIYWLTN